MAVQECGNGHLYDTDQYSSCPYCSGSGGMRIDFGPDWAGRTVSAADTAQRTDTTAAPGLPPAPAQASAIGVTVAPSNYTSYQNRLDSGRTVAVFERKMNFEPIVGWLVCIEGPEKGKDFRIYAKNNTIGRSERMDIYIKYDPTISRENYAKLAYDEKHNAFHLVPADSANNIYLNDEPVYVPVKLKMYDMIEFGEYKFVFMPFCNENFTWQNGLKLE